MQIWYFRLMRAVAVLASIALTWYSAQASFHHSHDWIGPLVAVVASFTLCFAEIARHHRQFVFALSLAISGLAAGAFSASLVYDRVNSGIDARAQQSRDHNSRIDAVAAALVEAKATKLKVLAKAEAELKEAKATVSSVATTVASEASKKGCAANCANLLQGQVTAAEAGVTAAQAKISILTKEHDAVISGLQREASGLGDKRVVTGDSLRERVMAAGLPIWLEITAPIIAAFAFSPWGGSRRSEVTSERKSKADLANEKRLARRARRKARKEEAKREAEKVSKKAAREARREARRRKGLVLINTQGR